MNYGVTPEGFVKKRLADIKKEVEDTLRSLLGNQINLITPSIYSKLVGIYSERESLIWELAEDCYNASYPDTAEGVSLDNVVAISGISRLGATFSRVEGAYLFGTPGTLIPPGQIASVNGNPTARFVTETNSILGAGQDAVQEINFNTVPDAGSFRVSLNGVETALIPFTANAALVQTEIRAVEGFEDITVTGNFTGGFVITFTGDSSGLRPQALVEIEDNSLTTSAVAVIVTPSETTPGVAQGVADLIAETEGAVLANARTLTVIETPVAGWDAIVNPQDAIAGRGAETDLELRQRRAQSLQVAGAATVEAIRSRLRNLQGVTSVLVIENDTDVTDGDGRPPHSFEAIVQGGDNQVIADEIWDAKAAGIRSYGNTTESVVDSQGITHSIQFSRPTPIAIYIEVDLERGPDYPVGGDALVIQKLVDRGNSAFGGGQDVIPIPTLIGVLDEIPGILDAEIRVGTAPNPTTDDNIPIGVGEAAVFDTDNVVVGTLP